ncbi:hypothetical protein BDV25DRAFT_128867 [Aspergillus avenaceus]|uniref:Transcription factor domain-containing protein n=1 Tax=Aspergillus avenaceus TaxID=36643 RepID=A0A5N6TYF4_ASPAV|nr:hypothetical protein BDV25DRAFT_128867 [Aspergillus avenaceus]
MHSPSSPISLPDTRTSSTKFISTKKPERAFEYTLVAEIFCHYIEHLASWYDLNDAMRHFEDIVPCRARKKSLLLSAILAFSAASLSSDDLKQDLWDLAGSYNLESVRASLRLTENIQEFQTGETLAAIWLLHSYEVISQDASCQHHLRGSYSLIAENITVAVMEKRSLLIELRGVHLPLMGDDDDDFANRVTCLLGIVINRCLVRDATRLGHHEWKEPRNNLETWRASLPTSFEPIHAPGLYGQSSFPHLWTMSGWHASGLQYYHIALSILSITKPASEPDNTLQRIDRLKAFAQFLDTHAAQVSALAVSSNSAAVWVNYFGRISFCWCIVRGIQFHR